MQWPRLLVDRHQRRHEVAKALQVERLLAVRERLVGARVDLDHDAVGADGDAARWPAAGRASACRSRGMGRR